MGYSTAMKLAEALAERKDCQIRIEELRKRLARSARIQEGEQPPEMPDSLLQELRRTFERLQVLIQAINRTNSSTRYDSEQTISDAIAAREVTGKFRDALTALAEAASTRQDRYSKSEVKFISTVNVGALLVEADQLARDFRVLDTRLQELNWSTDLTV